MQYIVYGAGAIGGAIGARLFQAGHNVTLICRGAHLDAVRARGLLLHAAEGDVRLAIPAVAHPRDLTFGANDVVIMTMKTQDTERALFDLETSGGGDAAIVCCQNGVESERIAARRFRHVYAMLVAMPATFIEPGEVTASSAPYTGVLHAGRYPDGVDETIARVCADLTSANLISEPDPRVMRLKYSKLLTNVGNAIQLITGGEWSDAGVRAIREQAAAEARACYAAAGVDYADDDEYAQRVLRFYRAPSTPGARVLSSTLQSVLRGNTTIEVDYLNGEAVLMGACHGVPTPVNGVLRRVAVAMAAAGEPPGRYSTDELAELIARERAAMGTTLPA